VTLASGTLPSAAGLGAWHNLALTFDGSTIAASIDGATVGTVTDTAYSTGKVGVFTGGYTAGDQFANLAVTALSTNGRTIPYSSIGSGVDQWQYSGSWSSGTDNTWSNTTGDTATLRFNGSSVALNSIVYNGQGIMAVSVDGGAATSVDLYRSSGTGATAPVFTRSGLDATVTHTLKVTVTGTKNPASNGTWASVAYAVVT
jgi:hypothetical protein